MTGDSEKGGSRAPAVSPWRAKVSSALPLPLAIVIGLAMGIGSYTFRYAEGLSYLSTDPKACVNCHIMRPEYDAWQKSSHHKVAVCVDCHLPHTLVTKYLVKAENGWRHGKKFTTQKFVEPIVIQAKGRAILQENCLRCHGGLVHEIVAASRHAGDDLPCTHCHSGVGHGEKAGIGGPLTAEEKRVGRDLRRE
jgi:cytochrome c nitrite reductase small subunit